MQKIKLIAKRFALLLGIFSTGPVLHAEPNMITLLQHQQTSCKASTVGQQPPPDTRPDLRRGSVKIIPAYSPQHYDQEIEKIYQKYPQDKNRNLATRIQVYSGYFLGQPYLLGALGEGPEGKFDKSPLYRTDAFDCVTYVSTVLALAKSNNLNQFKSNLKKIQYQDSKIEYQNRLHFTSIDWNVYNNKNGYLLDITDTIVNKDGQSVALLAKTNINKKNWYQQKKADTIKSFKALSDTQTVDLVEQLQALSEKVFNKESIVSYLPLNVLFNEKGEPNTYLFEQFPLVSVIEIVRPDWDVKDKIGTNLNISHLGFGLHINDQIIFRQASATEKQVIDSPLVTYLQQYLKSASIKGINIQLIRE